MAARRIDPRVVKLHRTYDVAELAERLGVHRNTVRHWQSLGLEPLDGARPLLFHGSTVRSFLIRRNSSRKSPCGPGMLYCFRCRSPRRPALGLVEYVPISATGGNLRALCGECETLMHRRAPKVSLATIMPGCDVQIAEAWSSLKDRPCPSLNCDVEQKATAR
jgi:hypothetical protein